MKILIVCRNDMSFAFASYYFTKRITTARGLSITPLYNWKYDSHYNTGYIHKSYNSDNTLILICSWDLNEAFDNECYLEFKRFFKYVFNIDQIDEFKFNIIKALMEGDLNEQSCGLQKS